MAKILFGVCGEGLGHANRSRILINYLRDHHDIKVVAGGKAFTFLSKEFDFVTEIESPRFVYKNSQVRWVHTILRAGYRTIIGSVPSFFVVRRLIKEFKPEVVITDADPISHYVARFYGLKRISIDNPQALLYRKYDVRLGEFFSWFALIVAVKIGVFGADKYIIYDFFDDQVDDNRVLFVKPLIQEGILKKKRVYGNNVFVYQTIGSNDYLLDIFKQMDEMFIIYGFNKDLVDGNLVYKKFNETDFYDDIAHAKAVITNGGFTVISEALYLKKPVLSLPIKHQFEQILNGRFVENLGAGVCHMCADREKLENFFNNLNQHRECLKLYDPGNQKKTLEQIEKEILTLISVAPKD